MELKNNMTNINKIIEEYFKDKRFDKSSHLELGDIRLTIAEQDAIVKKTNSYIKAQEQEHQKVTDFLIESHAFDMKELKEKHQKKLKEINEFGGDETDAYNLIDKLNEEK